MRRAASAWARKSAAWACRAAGSGAGGGSGGDGSEDEGAGGESLPSRAPSSRLRAGVTETLYTRRRALPAGHTRGAGRSLPRGRWGTLCPVDTGERSQRGTVTDTGRSPHARLRPVPIGAVRLADGFWKGRLETTRRVTLLQQLEQCEATGRIDNFRRAAGKKEVALPGALLRRFRTSTSGSKRRPMPWPAARTRSCGGACGALAEEIAGAQGPDGYLNTYFTFERAGERWTDLTRMHEMYCAGHLLQGAIAMHRATGERLLLDVAVRLADHICTTFGPQGRAGTDGHEEIELALVELYRETGDARYLRQAGFLLDQRGATPPLLSGTAYHQDHLPVREQREIVGHAVRATYLACGMADVYAETGERALLEGGADVCGRAPSGGRPTSPGDWARAGPGRRSARTTSCRTRRPTRRRAPPSGA